MYMSGKLWLQTAEKVFRGAPFSAEVIFYIYIYILSMNSYRRWTVTKMLLVFKVAKKSIVSLPLLLHVIAVCSDSGLDFAPT